MLTHTDLLEWFDDLSKIIFDTKISIDNIKVNPSIITVMAKNVQ